MLGKVNGLEVLPVMKDKVKDVIIRRLLRLPYWGFMPLRGLELM